MTIRVYLSNIVPGWPIQRQKELLAQHVPDWPKVPTYTDLLSPKQRKAHSPASLTERVELLRETSRPESIEAIVVAALPCLGWEHLDFLECVAAISARGATLIALNTDRRITPDATPTEIAEAAREFVTGRRATKGGPAGYLVSAEKREAEHRAAAKLIEDRWKLPTKDYPTVPLLAEAGICRNTANKYLLNRPEAQRKHRNEVARAERNRKRREMAVQAQVELA